MFEPIWLFFGALSFWSWLALIIFLSCAITAAAHENGLFAAGAFVLFGIIFWATSGMNAFAWIWNHPGWFVTILAGYIGIGGAWSVIKWNRLRSKFEEGASELERGYIETLHNQVKRYLEPRNRNDYRDEGNIVAVTLCKRVTQLSASATPSAVAEDDKISALLLSWSSALENGQLPEPEFKAELKKLASNYVENSPKIDRYKNRIFGWILGWPFSMIWYVIDDIVKDIAKWVFESLRGVYEGISKRSDNRLRARFGLNEETVTTAPAPDA